MLSTKTDIKKTANLIGFAYTAMFVLSAVLELILLLVLTLCGYSPEELVAFVGNNTVLMLLQIVVSGLMFTLPYMVIAKCDKRRIRELINFQKIEKGTLVPFVLLGVGVCKIAEFLAMQCGNIFTLFGITPSYNMGFTFERDIFSVVLAFLSVAVLPPLVEEFAVRGVVLGMLRPYGESFSIILSALFFGCMHGNLVQIPFAFVVGLGLGFITVKSGSMLPAIIVHFINNLTSVVMEYLLEGAELWTGNLAHIIIGVVWVFLGLLGLLLLSKRTDVFAPSKSVEEIPLRKKIGWSLGTPGVIIAVIITVVKILTA